MATEPTFGLRQVDAPFRGTATARQSPRGATFEEARNVHDFSLRDGCSRPGQVLVMIVWIFPWVMFVGICACLAYWVGRVRGSGVEAMQSSPVIARIRVARSTRDGSHKVLAPDTARATPEAGQGCRGGVGS